MSRKWVVVTGGTRGLGLDTCRCLVLEGYAVVAAGRTCTHELESLMDETRQNGTGEIIYRKLDLSDVASLHGFSKSLQSEVGPLFGLINNGAIARQGVLATMHDSEIQEVLSVNITGTIILTKYIIRSMLLEGTGRVVNIASIIASTGFNGLSVYGASKAALIGFTHSLAREVGKVGITVNAISPGYMKTDMSAGLNDEQLASIRRRSPMGRLVNVEDVSHAVVYLLSDHASAVTGINLTVDAGSTS